MKKEDANDPVGNLLLSDGTLFEFGVRKISRMSSKEELLAKNTPGTIKDYYTQGVVFFETLEFDNAVKALRSAWDLEGSAESNLNEDIRSLLIETYYKVLETDEESYLSAIDFITALIRTEEERLRFAENNYAFCRESNCSVEKRKDLLRRTVVDMQLLLKESDDERPFMQAKRVLMECMFFQASFDQGEFVKASKEMERIFEIKNASNQKLGNEIRLLLIEIYYKASKRNEVVYLSIRDRLIRLIRTEEERLRLALVNFSVCKKSKNDIDKRMDLLAYSLVDMRLLMKTGLNEKNRAQSKKILMDCLYLQASFASNLESKSISELKTLASSVGEKVHLNAFLAELSDQISDHESVRRYHRQVISLNSDVLASRKTKDGTVLSYRQQSYLRLKKMSDANIAESEESLQIGQHMLQQIVEQQGKNATVQLRNIMLSYPGDRFRATVADSIV